MPDSVFASQMTLDAGQYLRVSDEAQAATKRMQAAMQSLTGALAGIRTGVTGTHAPLAQVASAQQNAAAASHKMAQETRDAAVGFRGMGGAAGEAGKLIRDAFVAVPEIAALVSVFAGIGEAVGKIRESFTYGAELARTARETGETATAIAQLRTTFESFGVSGESVGSTLFMLQRSLGGVSESGEPTGAAFARIGLSIAQLKQMNAPAQFTAIQAGLARLPTQADRASVAMKIFGRSAQDLQSVLNADPADFAKTMAGAQEYAQVMGRNAAGFEQVSRKFMEFREQVDAVFAHIAAGLLPVVKSVLDAVNSIDFSKWGSAIEQAMKMVFKMNSQGTFADAIELSLIIGFKNAVNAFEGMVKAVATGLSTSFKDLFSGGFFEGLKDGFLGVAEAFVGQMMGFIQPFTDGLRASFNSILETLFYGINQAFVSAGLKKDASLTEDESLAVGPTTVEGIKAARVQNYNQQQLAAEGLSNLGPDSSDTQVNRYRQIMKGTYDPGSGIGGASADQFKQAGAVDLAKSGKELTSAISKISSDINAAYKGYTPATEFDTSADTNKLAAHIQKAQDAITADDKQDAAAAPKGTQAANQAAMTYKPPDSDRLAKVGLFVGSSSAAPGLSEARRTATATERMSKSIDQLLATTKNGISGYKGAVFAS